MNGYMLIAQLVNCYYDLCVACCARKSFGEFCGMLFVELQD